MRKIVCFADAAAAGVSHEEGVVPREAAVQEALREACALPCHGMEVSCGESPFPDAVRRDLVIIISKSANSNCAEGEKMRVKSAAAKRKTRKNTYTCDDIKS